MTLVDNITDVIKEVAKDISATNKEVDKKVDKVSGKQLSTNDYTTTEKNKLGGIESGAQVNVPTNLSNKATTTTVSVNSSTGSNTTILNATSGRSGVMTSADKVKLDNLPTGVGGVIPLTGGGTGATTASGARTNLQLGNHVTHNYGTSANTVMMGNDQRANNGQVAYSWGNHSEVGYVTVEDNQTISGTKTFSSFPVTPSTTPTTNYQVANKKYVDDRSIGVNQRWYDLTASRNSNTEYTNDSGRPIFVSISVSDRGAGISALLVDGVQVGQDDIGTTGTSVTGTLSTIVPHGSICVLNSGSAQSIIKWAELR